MRVERRGFTLVELTVAMVVSALCVSLAMGAWLQFRSATLAKEKRYLAVLDCESRIQAVYKKLRGARLLEATEDDLIWQLANGSSWNMSGLDSVLPWSSELLDEHGIAGNARDTRLVKIFWEGRCGSGITSELMIRSR